MISPWDFVWFFHSMSTMPNTDALTDRDIFRRKAEFAFRQRKSQNYNFFNTLTVSLPNSTNFSSTESLTVNRALLWHGSVHVIQQ